MGRHGAVPTATARRQAMAVISEAKGGRDSEAPRDARRKASTMKQLGRRFLEDYVPNHCKPSTALGKARPSPLQDSVPSPPEIERHSRAGIHAQGNRSPSRPRARRRSRPERRSAMPSTGRAREHKTGERPLDPAIRNDVRRREETDGISSILQMREHVRRLDADMGYLRCRHSL